MIEFILNRFFIFIIAIILGLFYKRFIDKYEREDEIKRYELIRHYLLNETDIATSTLPILWIHVPYELNSRSWESFSSRSSMELNLSYIQLTISSIIKHCGRDFKICLIDDKSFMKLIPGWSNDLDIVGSPLKEKIRFLAKLKLLDYYGGMFVPQSFLCLKSLKDMMYEGTRNNLPFICEKSNNTLNGGDFIAGLDILGSPKNNPHMQTIIRANELLISQDYTSASTVVGKNEQLFSKMIGESKLNVIDSKHLGVKDIDEKPILLEDLFSRDYIKFDNLLYGILIPHEQLLKRTAYNWFCKLSEIEVLQCDTILCKYFLMSNEY
jgi:hypothetical protein